MRMRILSVVTFSLVVMSLVGCGFGGFSGGDGSGPASGSNSSDTGTMIGGMVSKGMFNKGTVRIYAVNSDGSETLLRSTSINGYGNYSANIGSSKTSTNGSYTGVHLIKAAGSYIDEATGSEMSIDDQHPLRAVIENPSGSLKVAVTPLTELAARKALAGQSGNGQPTAKDVKDANALVSEMFKVDIIGTMPVEANQSENGFGRAMRQDQKDYTLALAAISQMARDNPDGMAGTLNVLSSDLADGSMSAESATAFQTALVNFLASPSNLTGVTDIKTTNLVNVGGTTKIVRLATSEKPGTGAMISAISVTLLLPPGVTLLADLFTTTKIEKEPLQGGVTASGVGGLAGTRVEAAYIGAAGSSQGMVRISLMNQSSFVAGEFASIRCEIPAGASYKSTDFGIYRNVEEPNDPRNFRAFDGNGAAFPSDVITVEIVPDAS